MKKKRIAFIINHLSFFCSHILPLAKDLKKKGHKIQIYCGYGGSQEMEQEAKKIIKLNKLNFFNVGFKPSSKNIFLELFFFLKIIKNLKKFKPDVIHGISFKGIIYGCLFFIFFRSERLINFVTGLGYFFTRKLNLYEKVIKKIVILIIKFTLKQKNSILVIENDTDKNYFINKVKIDKRKIYQLDGAGVNLKKFYLNKKLKKNIVLFPARVLLEKGINEFISSSKYLSKKYPDWKFLIAGTLKYEKDDKNKIFTDYRKIEKKFPNIKFLGYVKKMDKLFNKSSIACLPSYREGFPKSIIEASASGCSIVCSNVPGCRDVIKKNHSGLLCKPKNILDLSLKIEKLILNKSLRMKLGKNARLNAEKRYDINLFIKKNLNFYF